MATEQTPTGNEPGELDSRLTLNPNDERWSDSIEDWEDDKEYSMTVKARQISPGEFEVLDITDAEAYEEPAEEEAEEPAKPANPSKTNKNPAVNALINSRK